MQRQRDKRRTETEEEARRRAALLRALERAEDEGMVPETAKVSTTDTPGPDPRNSKRDGEKTP